jgi:hypothetical protein
LKYFLNDYFGCVKTEKKLKTCILQGAEEWAWSILPTPTHPPNHPSVISQVMPMPLQFLVCRSNYCCCVIVTLVLHSGDPCGGSHPREEIVAHFP